MTGQDNSRYHCFTNLNAKNPRGTFYESFFKRISRVCYLYHFYCVRIAADSGGTPAGCPCGQFAIPPFYQSKRYKPARCVLLKPFSSVSRGVRDRTGLSRDIRFANLNVKSPRGTFYESFFRYINIKAPSLHFYLFIFTPV